MKTRDVFRILREVVEPSILPARFSVFKDCTGGFLIWTRPVGRGKYETISCQMDKWPWDPWTGSRFRVSMNRSSRRGNVALCKDQADMADLLTGEERREVQTLQNRVIVKCREPSKEEYNDFMGFAAYNALTVREYREKCAPVEYSDARHFDLWLRIVDADDVREWGRYLAAWLPKVLDRTSGVALNNSPDV